MGKLFSAAMPDWTDRDEVAEHAAQGAMILGNDPDEARKLASRIWERTTESSPPAHMANQLGIVFSKLDCAPRWRERLKTLTLPTLVIHGGQDPFFPIGNAHTLAREIPKAKLLVLEQASTAIPATNIQEVATAMLQLEGS